MLTDIRTSTITSKGQIVIPKEMRDTEPFKQGKKVAIISFGDRIEIRPLTQLQEEIEPFLMSHESLKEEWSGEKEDEAWKHL